MKGDGSSWRTVSFILLNPPPKWKIISACPSGSTSKGSGEGPKSCSKYQIPRIKFRSASGGSISLCRMFQKKIKRLGLVVNRQNENYEKRRSYLVSTAYRHLYFDPGCFV